MYFLDKTHTNCLKGVAISMVLLCHVMVMLFPSNIARLATPLGGIGVALFLILSGYGLSYSYEKSLQGFWKKRFVGTFIPYIIVFLITLPFKIYSDFWGFVYDFFAMKPIVTYYWYLGYLFLWYLIFYFFNKIKVPHSIKVIIIAFVCGCMMIFFDSLRAEQTFSFLLGCLLFRYKDRATKFLLRKSTVIVSFIVGFGFLMIKQTGYIRNAPDVVFNTVQVFIKVPFAIFLFIATYHLLKMLFFKKTMSYSGKYSYELYLVHSVTILMFSFVTINKYVILPIFIITTILITILFNKVNRKISGKILRR